MITGRPSERECALAASTSARESSAQRSEILASRLQVATRDPDLGRTLLLWLRDILDEHLSRAPAETVIIDDEGRAGLPFRRSRRGSDGVHVVRESAGTVRVTGCSSLLFLRRRPMVEAVRRLLVLRGLAHDMRSIDHFQVSRRQQEVRQQVCRALALRPPDSPCRFVLRIDDYPSPGGEDLADFVRFHEVLAEHRIPYLLAITPFLKGAGRSGSLTDPEIDVLRRCCQEGVDLALHGFTHQSRYTNFASELASLPPHALHEELDRAEEYLTPHGFKPLGFVPPFNSYDPLTLSILAERFPLLCGGPESVLSLGYRVGPSFLLRSLYVPSYRHAYDFTLERALRLDQLARESRGLVVPLTLHWPNEVRDGFRRLREVCGRLVGNTWSWQRLLSWAGCDVRCGRSASPPRVPSGLPED